MFEWKEGGNTDADQLRRYSGIIPQDLTQRAMLAPDECATHNMTIVGIHEFRNRIVRGVDDGEPFKVNGSNNYYIRYWKAGRRIQEANGTADYTQAEQVLHERLGEIAKNTFVSRENRSILIDTLYDAMLTSKELELQASLQGD